MVVAEVVPLDRTGKPKSIPIGHPGDAIAQPEGSDFVYSTGERIDDEDLAKCITMAHGYIPPLWAKARRGPNR
jgi:hypothetical protein